MLLLAAAVLAGGLVLGIGRAVASNSPAPPAGKSILRLGWTREPDNLNPFIGYDTSSYEVWALNYDLLVGFRPSDMANVPGLGLATHWRTTHGGKVWTFTITDKARWQDGVPLTARDVAFTYNYVLKNKMGMFIDYLRYITRVQATDATHVVFTCSKPKANMLGLWIPILPNTSGATSARRTPPRASGTGRPSSARGRSSAWSGSPASTCAWWPTSTTGAGRPRWTRSSSRPTRTPTP